MISSQFFEQLVFAKSSVDCLFMRCFMKMCFLIRNSVQKSSGMQKETPAQMFACEFEKFLRTPTLKIICERLFLPIKVLLLVNPFHVTSVFLYSENIRKPQIFWCFQGAQKNNSGMEEFNRVSEFFSTSADSLKFLNKSFIWERLVRLIKLLLCSLYTPREHIIENMKAQQKAKIREPMLKFYLKFYSGN